MVETKRVLAWLWSFSCQEKLKWVVRNCMWFLGLPAPRCPGCIRWPQGIQFGYGQYFHSICQQGMEPFPPASTYVASPYGEPAGQDKVPLFLSLILCRLPKSAGSGDFQEAPFTLMVPRVEMQLTARVYSFQIIRPGATTHREMTFLRGHFPQSLQTWQSRDCFCSKLGPLDDGKMCSDNYIDVLTTT